MSQNKECRKTKVNIVIEEKTLYSMMEKTKNTMNSCISTALGF